MIKHNIVLAINGSKNMQFMSSSLAMFLNSERTFHEMFLKVSLGIPLLEYGISVISEE